MSSFVLRHSELLYSNKFEKPYLQPDHWRPIEWFRPPGSIPQPSINYGPFTGIYKLNRSLNLLNLGDPATRYQILSHTSLSPSQFDPNEQYSSHGPNLIVHEAILCSNYFKRFDGTILVTSLIHPSLLDDLEGAEEVVLFKNRIHNAVSLIKIEG